ncbi:rab effector MyRIP-like [Oncorhynchus clarkii lewisi]|uniref:rab effector MyRIP-like n=1 Tax=Oncorhynchus clarkii lewisi TaxID=490388 RepID=UPI0039B85F60
MCQCLDCQYNVCKTCRSYSKKDKAWVCSECWKGRSVWREYSMAKTLTVALRVAEEAIDEAIYKAEGYTDNQDMQSEARYLRDHRKELIEELATTIVQTIIRQRKNLVEMKPNCDLDWPPGNHSGEKPLASSCPSSQPQITTSVHAKCVYLPRRSRSASLLDDNVVMQCFRVSQDSQQGLKEEGGAAGLASGKRIDRLDNSMLKSPDGNWIALQSTQLSRPSLLNKWKSLVFSVLEWEFGVISACNEMGSYDAEGAWDAALLEIRRKMTSSANNNQGSEAPDAQASAGQQPSIPLPSLGHHASTNTLNFECGEMGGKWHGPRRGEMEGERRRGQVEKEKPWHLGVMMVVEGRMMNEKRRDRITELDVRLFDFEDESEKEGELQHEETDTKRYSEVSLHSITTEVLKVLNATEDRLQGVEGDDCIPSLSPNTDTKRLDKQLSRLEDTVYVVAGTAYGLEAELGDLEDCARAIGGATSDLELSYLEEQVATASAQVQQSDLQVSEIADRIAALKIAGLNVVPQNRFFMLQEQPKPQTLDSSRQTRRRLPAPPLKDKET